MKHEENHIAEIVEMAHGKLKKSDYAKLIDIDPTRVSSRLPGDYERAIKHLSATCNQLQEDCKLLQVEKADLQVYCKSLQEECKSLQVKCKDLQVAASESQVFASRMQEAASGLQVECKDLQAECKQLQDERKGLQEDASRLQAFASDLQANARELQEAESRALGTCKNLQADIVELQAEKARIKSRLDAYEGQPALIRMFGSSSTRAVLAVLLAVFEVAGTIHLLTPKGIVLAVCIGVGMGYSLLAFAASGNEFGKWFCIVFSFAVGAIFFEPWNTGLPQDWLFAFVPPVVNATIINTFK